MPTGIWSSWLRSGSAHCDLEVAVEVRQCPLGSGAREEEAAGEAAEEAEEAEEAEVEAEEEEENSSDKI